MRVNLSAISGPLAQVNAICATDTFFYSPPALVIPKKKEKKKTDPCGLAWIEPHLLCGETNKKKSIIFKMYRQYSTGRKSQAPEKVLFKKACLSEY